MDNWSSDFEMAPGGSFGDWLYAQIADGVVIEEEGFFPDRVRTAAARLQAYRPASQRFTTVVVWFQEFNAFTAPGKYVYFSRRLLERCLTEDAAAFVIAHEIAHHELGHIGTFQGAFARRAARLNVGVLAILFFRILQKRIYNPELELAADRRAIDMCLKAGYDVEACLHLFEILEIIALDYGDFGAVYGLDVDSEDELSAEASFVTKARIWLYQRERGYLPLQDRRAELAKYIKQRHRITVSDPHHG